MTIRCDKMTVRYGATIAVDQVTFDVRQGEIYGLLGPNGAGKTSIIRALTTILEPDAGTATIDGIGLEEPARVRERIGVLPESSGYPGSRSALEYLTYHGRLFGIDADSSRERADELLQQVGLGEHRHQRVATYSRGMRQRLGIARALVNRPTVLFLDEPTLGLDPAGKQDILSYLRRDVVESGTSVVLCSHLLDDVERVCHRVGIMHHARVVASGTVAEVVAEANLGGGARIEVDPIDLPQTIEMISAQPGMMAKPAETPGRIDVELRPGGPGLNDVARLLADEDVSFLALEARGARLSDAFLNLTGASPEEVTA